MGVCLFRKEKALTAVAYIKFHFLSCVMKFGLPKNLVVHSFNCICGRLPMKDTVFSLTLVFVMLFSCAFTNLNSLKKNHLSLNFSEWNVLHLLLFFFILLFKKCVFRQKIDFFRMGLSWPGLYDYSVFQQTTQLTLAFCCCSAVLAWLIICLLTDSRSPCLFCPLCSNAGTYPCIYFYESLYITHSGMNNKLSESKILIKGNISLLLPSREHFLSIKHCIAIVCHVMDSSQDFSKLCACVFMSFQPTGKATGQGGHVFSVFTD